MSHRDDVDIAKAVLSGCEPVYHDFGHPERAQARKYWTALSRRGGVAYGYTRAECARRWLLLEQLPRR